jgi:hypothetical protein
MNNVLGKQARISDSTGEKDLGRSTPTPGKTTLVQQLVQRGQQRRRRRSRPQC